MKITESEADVIEFQALRRQFEIDEAEALMLYKRRIAFNFIDEPKLFWNYISERRRDFGYLPR